MHVVFGVEGQVVVVDVRHAVDVQAAGGHVGGHQQVQLALLEAAEQGFALLLGHVARQHANAETGAFKRLGHAFHPDLGVDEDHGALAFAAGEQADQQRDLFFVRRQVNTLADPGGGDRLGFDDQLLGLVHVFVGELEHAVAERGAEQQGLAFGADRHAPQQEADVLDEAQVEHAVGFVEHADLAGVQGHDLVLLDVIDEPAGGGDDDVHALLQEFALLVVIDAAVDQGEAQAQVGAELHGVLVDLDGQFAGGGEDEGARVFGLAVGQGRAREQPVHQRDQEGQGLAGAGLGLAGDVTARQGDRQGQGLDGGAAGETRGFEAGLEVRVQLETGKSDIGQWFVGHVGLWLRVSALARPGRGVANCPEPGAADGG